MNADGDIDIAELSLDDAYLQHGVVGLTAEQLKELREYVGYADMDAGAKRSSSSISCADSEAAAARCASSESSSSKGNAAGKEQRKGESIAKAKKWMLNSLAEYESARREDWEQRYVQEKRIFDTIAFALHYLGDSRLTFGGHGQEWLNGLILEISRLREQRDELLMMDVTLPCLLIVSKLLDLAPPEFSLKLLDTCKALARRVYDRHVRDGVLLKGRACGDLFKIFNNIACILMQLKEENEAEQWIKDATTFVRDEEDEADVFLCNSASLISALSDNFKEAEDLFKRAEAAGIQALSARQQALETLQDGIKTRQDKLESMLDAFLNALPAQGKEFIVRVEGDQTKFIDDSGPNLEAEISRLESQLGVEMELLGNALMSLHFLCLCLALKVPVCSVMQLAHGTRGLRMAC